MNPGMIKRTVAVVAVVAGVAQAQRDDRVRVTAGAGGLPDQIAIAAAPWELPLQSRGASDEAQTAVLTRIGRGPQLRAPVRLEVVRNGQTEAAVAAGAATRDGETAKGRLKAGPTTIDVAARGTGGTLELALTYGGGSVDSLALVFELAGTVDFALAGAPKPGLSPQSLALKAGEGLVWSCAGGVPTHLFVGSGDRGWTVLGGDAAGWRVKPDAPVSTLTRGADGTVTWRLFLVNAPGKLEGTKTAALTLLTHPQRQKPDDWRRQAWLAWPPTAEQGAAAPALTQAEFLAFKAGPAVLRADAASAYEPFCGYAVLAEASGGDAVDAQQDVIVRYPAALFRYLAGTHAGQVRRIEGNSATLTGAGANRTLDRTLLGRALVNDIGVDAARLAHLADGARVLGILERFGAFEADGETEVIPWWRTAGVIRFGEGASADDVFSFVPGEDDPASRVRVAVYRRPLRKGAKETHSLVVLFNENEARVRDQLYVLNPELVFGGNNVLKDIEVATSYPFSRMPDNNDWSKASVVLENRMRTDAVMRDEEDGGVVRRVAAKDGIETYGPMISIGGRDFRIFYGRGK